MNKAYLGLDLGTSMGFARFDQFESGSSYLTGAWNFQPTRFDAPSMRYINFERQLEAHLTLGVDRLFYEKVLRHRGTTAAHVYGAFLAKLQETCDRFNVPYVGLSVQEIKKHATGKGNASKEDVIAACKIWGFNPKADDEADAIAILRCGMETKL